MLNAICVCEIQTWTLDTVVTIIPNSAELRLLDCTNSTTHSKLTITLTFLQ